MVTNDDGNDDCALKMYTTAIEISPNDFDTKIFTAITHNSNAVYGVYSSNEATDAKNMDNLFGENYIDLGVVNKSGGTNVYNWYATFDKNTENNYQGAITRFDIRLNFVCDHSGSDHQNDDAGDSGGGDTDGTGDTGGAQGLQTFISSFIGASESGEVAGSESEEPKEKESTIEGAQTGERGVCVDPKYWMWLFIFQAVLQLIGIPVIFKKKLHKRILITMVGFIFAVIFYIYFCPKWDVLVSLLISLITMLLATEDKDKNDYRRF